MLKQIFQMTQQQLADYVLKYLKEIKEYQVQIGYDSNRSQQFIAGIGNIPVVLIAHLDTVFKDEARLNIEIYYDKEQGVMWSPNGLGADDRAGVYMILQILKTTKLRPHVLFTFNEEISASGAYLAANVKETIFKNNVSYIIELDRKGYQEAVYYDCKNTKFEEYINSFGFHTEQGLFTDISIICPQWNIAGVNLSVGYYLEHSYIEHFYLSFWLDTYKKVVKMLEDKNGYKKRWKYEKEE